MRLTARVPATSANLGPGFDCFGLALDLCNDVTIDADREPGVTWEGEGAGELPTDGTDGVSRAMRLVAEEAHRELPPLHLHGLNRIPLERGLGSSAAAAVAGIALGRHLLGLAGDSFSRRDVALAAADLEGHPDNAAPATHGGLVVVVEETVHTFEVSNAIRPVVLIPDGVRLSTERARRVLPELVRLEDAAYNVGHASLVIQALVSGDLDLLGIAMRDRLHQSVRLAEVPAVREVFARLAESVPVCVSGSGPSLLAFEIEGRPMPDPGAGWQVLRVPVRTSGVEIAEE
jgi:homoserine kinase